MNRKLFLKAICAGAASFTAACRRPQPAKAPPSPTRADQLVERIIEHNIATLMVGATYIGDRLGLFRAMAGAGPVTAERLASKAGVNPRYALEWLRAMASSSYIDYHPASGAFELPAEHAAVLVDEESPLFCAGIPEGTVADILMVPRVLSAVRSGKGIPYSDYPAETFDSIERSSKPEYRHLLTQQWLPAVPGVVDRLRAGGSAADLGSGAGLASIAIAQAYPSARAFGFEPYAPSVARASQNARDAGLAARVQFSTFDGVHVPRGPFDLITINYALHHAGDPVGPAPFGAPGARPRRRSADRGVPQVRAAGRRHRHHPPPGLRIRIARVPAHRPGGRRAGLRHRHHGTRCPPARRTRLVSASSPASCRTTRCGPSSCSARDVVRREGTSLPSGVGRRTQIGP